MGDRARGKVPPPPPPPHELESPGECPPPFKVWNTLGINIDLIFSSLISFVFVFMSCVSCQNIIQTSLYVGYPLKYRKCWMIFDSGRKVMAVSQPLPTPTLLNHQVSFPGLAKKIPLVPPHLKSNLHPWLKLNTCLVLVVAINLKV